MGAQEEVGGRSIISETDLAAFVTYRERSQG